MLLLHITHIRSLKYARNSEFDFYYNNIIIRYY